MGSEMCIRDRSKPIFPIAIIGLKGWAVVASNRPPKPASRINKSTFLKSKKFSAQQIICSKGDNLWVERLFFIFLNSLSNSSLLIFSLFTLILSQISKR